MITIQNIIDWSKPHPLREGGRVTVISNNAVKFSILECGSMEVFVSCSSPAQKGYKDSISDYKCHEEKVYFEVER